MGCVGARNVEELRLEPVLPEVRAQTLVVSAARNTAPRGPPYRDHSKTSSVKRILHKDNWCRLCELERPAFAMQDLVGDVSAEHKCAAVCRCDQQTTCEVNRRPTNSTLESASIFMMNIISDIQYLMYQCRKTGRTRDRRAERAID